MIITTSNLKSKDVILSSRGLSNGGSVQNYIDETVLNYSEPYIPKKTGNLIHSGTALGGSVLWSVPYAKKQYYTNKGNGLRGSFWFMRMWSDRKDEILQGARSVMNDIRKRSIFSKAVSTSKKRDILGRLLKF